MYSFSERSLDQLKTLHPLLRAICEVVIKEMDFIVLCGYRGPVEQNTLYTQGYSKNTFPNGKHNTKPSKAVDLAPWPINWKDRDRFILF